PNSRRSRWIDERTALPPPEARQNFVACPACWNVEGACGVCQEQTKRIDTVSFGKRQTINYRDLPTYLGFGTTTPTCYCCCPTWLGAIKRHILRTIYRTMQRQQLPTISGETETTA
ncbi:unnamed protein product, partial [Ectocarpus sp. 6 AP-2014]